MLEIVQTFTVRHQFICIGHSLGGLISRYAFGELSLHPLAGHTGAKTKLEWNSFISMCTPHLGVRKPGFGSVAKFMWKKAFYVVAPNFHGQTGRDLLIKDTATKNFNPSTSILMAMTELGSTYMNGLEDFQHRTAMAMADHDILVPYPT